jgi:hypothetical protein
MLRSLKARQVKDLILWLGLFEKSKLGTTSLMKVDSVHQLIGFGDKHRRVAHHEVAALDTFKSKTNNR